MGTEILKSLIDITNAKNALQIFRKIYIIYEKPIEYYEVETMDYSGFRGELKLIDNRTVYVRKIESTDGPKLKVFFEFLGPESSRLFSPHLYTDNVIERRIERALLGDDWVYIALSGDRVAGYFFLWSIKERVPILGIGIADNWQNCRLGQKFMAILIEDAKQLGKVGIELTTMLDNDRAFHIYKKMGFQHYGDVKNQIGDGQIIVERGMFLPLKEGIDRPDTRHECPE